MSKISRIAKLGLLVTAIGAGFFLNQTELFATENDSLTIEISDLDDAQLAIQAFQLNQDGWIRIEAVGCQDKDDDEFLAFGWILDSDSRRMVWNFRNRTASRKNRQHEVWVKDKIRLAAGTYELIYTIAPAFTSKKRQVEKFFNNFWDQFRSRQEVSSAWGIKVHCSQTETGCRSIAINEIVWRETPAVQLIEVGDDYQQTAGFSLSQETRLHLYALGESDYSYRQMADYAWIIDANTRTRVWEMTTENTESAGGSRKNRVFNGLINLPPGDYIVHYISDDSHSYHAWNESPPDDPRFWGITIWAKDAKSTPVAIKPFKGVKSDNLPIVAITRMRDDEFESQGFRLVQPTKLRIYALGEAGSDRKMADYGWIVNAHTGEKVWQMNYDETEHAGGGRKNRIFDQVIELPAGDYVVYYLTDDSHSYRDWNVSPPSDPDAWGITIWGVGEKFNRTEVQSFRTDENPAILAQIIRVGDDEDTREKFTLARDQQVLVYALGEGDRDGMYDYGWIEDQKGRIVWKMTFKKTEHAGGARKNRRIKTELPLEAGTYYLIYQSDGSHSYQDWNDDPPDDPIHWGISVMTLEKE